jgi:hypothetical protein
MSARRGAAALGAATALALTAGCGVLGLGAEEEPSDEERLVEMLNENNRLQSELMAAELRIVQNCLEAAGHTVHEPWTMQAWEPEEQEALNSYYPHEDFLVDPEEAAQYGFGQWAQGPDAGPEAEEYWQAQEEEGEEESNWEEPDTTEWDALAPEEQYAWYVAYQGEEYATEMYGTEQDYVDMMSGEGEEYAEEELTEEELAALEEEAAAEEEGEIDVEEQEAYEEPKPGGCQLEMIEALYGEPRLVEYTYDSGEGGSMTDKYWEYRPKNPLEGEESETMWEDLEADYAAAMGDKQMEFIDCITAKGYEGWEFTEYNSLPLWEFYAALYYQDDPEMAGGMTGDSDVEVPPLPENAGSTFEEWKAYEIQMAVDFAQCGEDIGYADASKKAYDDAHIKFYENVEEAMYAWQEQMSDSISKAQEVLDA